MAELEEQKVMELYMPSGLKLKKEYFPGFGKDELIPTMLSVFIFLIIDSVIFMAGVHNVTVLFFILLFGISTTGMMQVKGELNLSPVDIIKLEFRFVKSQKYYPYIAKNEWENIE